MPDQNYLKKLIVDELHRRNSDIERLELHLLQEQSTNIDNDQQWTDIRQMTIVDLLAALKCDQLTPMQVLQAYQQSAIVAHRQTNCLVDVLQDADTRARQLYEKYRNKPADSRPALYGLPVSIKVSIDVKSQIRISGFAIQLAGKPAENDAIIVDILKENGAIPFVRTNVPQTLIIHAAENPIYGRTDHHLDARRTPGGSSSGEGPLIALGGSPLGIGTDALGSVRIPASFCGIVAFKPTRERVSQDGCAARDTGVKNMGVNWGPMSPDVTSAIELLRVVFDSPITHFRDPYRIPFPFRNSLLMDRKPLTIGWFEDDQYTHVLPVMKRAVIEAKHILEANGHHLVEWVPKQMNLVHRCSQISFLPDGGARLIEAINADIAEPSLWRLFAILRLPIWIRSLISAFCYWILGSERLANYFGWAIGSSYELRDTFARVDIYKRDTIDEWRSLHLDAVICPAFAHPAPPSDLPVKTTPYLTATGLFNLLDFPAGVLPITTFNADDQMAIESWTPLDYFDRLTKQAFTSANQSNIGLPIAIQCAALPNHDEICLRIMREIEQNCDRKQCE